MNLLDHGFGIYKNGGVLVYRKTETIAQGCGWSEKVGDAHPTLDGVKCVLVVPPSDCDGGCVVWESPFIGSIGGAD